MFRKLKQKIEHEGTVKTSPVKPSSKSDADGHESTNKPTQEPPPVQSEDPKVSEKTSSTEDINSSVSAENHINSTDIASADSSLNITPDNNDLSVNDNRPRRQNLAATVLRYGEEISAKNKVISELEQQITDLSTQITSRAEGSGGDGQVELMQGKLIECERCKRQLEDKLTDRERTITNLEKTLQRLEATDTSNTSIISKLESQLNDKQIEVCRLSETCEQQKNQIVELEASLQFLQTKIDEQKSELTRKDALLESLQREVKDSSQSQAASNSNPASDSSELKTKLHRAHSLTKQLELQLQEKTTELEVLVQENRVIKSSLETNKQQSVDELLSVSKGESHLRQELSSTITKLSTLESQHKTQGRLLAEKQKNMATLELTLEKQLTNSKKEKSSLISTHTLQVTELQRKCDALKLSLDSETQAHKRVKEELDSLREEALDKQLDDEKQLSDLHEQLSGLRGEVRQLERSKKKELDLIQLELNNRDKRIADLDKELSSKTSQYNIQVEHLRNDVSCLERTNDELQLSLSETQDRLRSVDTERDELYLRNADLSSKLEKTKMELKSLQSDYDREKTALQTTIHSNELSEKNSTEKVEALEEKITLLQDQISSNQLQSDEVQQANNQIADLRQQLTEQERTISDKTKSMKIQQQTISDLKKTIKRELKGHDPSVSAAQGHLEVRGNQDIIERVRSSPALSDLSRYDSPVEDNVPSASHDSTRTTMTATSSLPNSAAVTSSLPHTKQSLSQQYRHEVNGFCGHKDINFEYLKNVVFSFLVSRETESIHLVRAIAVILEFTKAEEKLLKETLEWKMSWWPNTKKPSKKVRK